MGAHIPPLHEMEAAVDSRSTKRGATIEASSDCDECIETAIEIDNDPLGSAYSFDPRN